MKPEEFTNKFLSEATLADAVNNDVLRLSTLFRKNGHTLRIVGGAVRDLIRGIKPKDIDLATDATPDEMVELLSDKYNVIPTGLQHGTITVVINEEPYEITTLRMDKETDGRHAEIVPAKEALPNGSVEDWWKMDAERRDLTYNALSLDPLTSKVYDYFGGVDDLKKGVTRFVGDTDKRIQEDYLRILRFFRFLGRTKGKADDETKEAIKRNAKGLQRISVERIWMEMQKIITGDNLRYILNLIENLEVSHNIGLKINSIDRAVEVNKVSKNPVTILTALVGPVNAENLVKAWKMSVDEQRVVNVITKIEKEFDGDVHEFLLNVNDPQKHLPYVAEWLRYKNKPTEANEYENWTYPSFPVTGQDLISSGINPGPEMGKTLKKLKKVWKDSSYKKTKEELLELI